MSDNDLFGGENNGTDLEPQSYREVLVGEGKKFQDDEALARGKWEADRTIAERERELAELRKELDKRLTLEELTDKIRQEANQRNASTDTHNQGDPERDENTNSALTPEDLEKLVEKEFSKNQQKQLHLSNLEKVRSKLASSWGDNYKTTLRRKCEELNLEEDFANGLAATKPDAFLKLVMDKQDTVNTSDFTPPRGTARPAPNLSGGRKTYSDFQKMRRENPREYWKPAVQNELNTLALKYGADFYK